MITMLRLRMVNLLQTSTVRFLLEYHNDTKACGGKEHKKQKAATSMLEDHKVFQTCFQNHEMSEVSVLTFSTTQYSHHVQETCSGVYCL